MYAPDAAMWVEERDHYGSPTWRNTHTGEIRYTNPWRESRTVAPHLNGGQKSVRFNLELDPVAGGWEECFDTNTGRKYWCNSITGETTWIDPQVATKKPPPPPPPSSPPSGSNPLLRPLSPLPLNQPGWSFTQAPSSFDAPPALGDPPSMPPSMPSRHGPSSKQTPAALGDLPTQMPAWPSWEGRKQRKHERPLTPPPSDMPAWNASQPFSTTFPPPPQTTPAWTSDQPRSEGPPPPPAFKAMSPQPPPPPPPPAEFTPWQFQPSAPSGQPPPPPTPPPPSPPAEFTPWQFKPSAPSGQPPPPPLPPPPLDHNKSDRISGNSGGGGGKKGDGETVAKSWKPNLVTREQDDWSQRVNAIGRKEWFNQKTGKSQISRPDCLRKYR